MRLESDEKRINEASTSFQILSCIVLESMVTRKVDAVLVRKHITWVVGLIGKPYSAGGHA